MSLRIELVSPERVVFEGDAELVIARTSVWRNRLSTLDMFHL